MAQWYYNHPNRGWVQGNVCETLIALSNNWLIALKDGDCGQGIGAWIHVLFAIIGIKYMVDVITDNDCSCIERCKILNDRTQGLYDWILQWSEL